MSTALLIARKDLRQRVRDKSVFIFGILAPLGLSVIFSFVFGPVSDVGGFHAHYVVVDQDGGELADAFVSTLEAVQEEGIISLRQVDSEDEARDMVEAASDALGAGEDAADAAFIIPAGFSGAIQGGSPTRLRILGSGASQLGVQVAESIASGFASEVGAIGLAVFTAVPSGAPPDPATVGALVPLAAQTSDPITIEDVSARTKQLDYLSYLSAGMAAMFLFFTVQFGVMGLLEERQLGTMSRLLAAPIERRSLILGKALTSFVLGIVGTAVLLVTSTLMLGADYGDPLGVAALVFSIVIAAMGILAVVAAFAKTQEQAGNFGAIVSLVLAFLGGTFFDVSQAGGILEKLSLITPHAWFLRGLSELQGGDIADILPSVSALLAFGLVAGVFSWPFLKKAVER